MTPLFISDLQKTIKEMPANDKQPVNILVWVNEKDEYRTLNFEVPVDKLIAENKALYRKYLLAMINNMLSIFGGARMEIYYHLDSSVLTELLDDAIAEYKLDSEKNDRPLYGVFVNYINRMNKLLGLGKFEMIKKDIAEYPTLDPKKQYHIYVPTDVEAERKILRLAAEEMDGKAFCNLDVGGNSIKVGVVKDGNTLALMEYRWYPTANKTAAEMNDPIILLARFMGLCVRLYEKEGTVDAVKNILDGDVSYGELLKAAEELEAKGYAAEGVFDGIVIGYPDIIVHNKVAGGETQKQMGMKYNPDTDYDVEFFKTSDINDMVRPYGKKDAPVVVLNDGNATSYISSVEQVYSPDKILDEYGTFANSLGTELGTGFMSIGGTIQHIPLEGYMRILDLGNDEYLSQEPFDLRSVRSVNTSVPGMAQKYICQFGLFRLVITELWERKDPMLDELMDLGYVAYDEEKDYLYAVTEPVDMRGKLTRHIVGKLAEGNEIIINVFKTMGHAMGVHFDQDLLIFPEIKPARLLSGGVIANDLAYKYFQEGLNEYNPEYKMIRLDEDHVYSPLLKKMTAKERTFTAAIASAYIANRILVERDEK